MLRRDLLKTLLVGGAIVVIGGVSVYYYPTVIKKIFSKNMQRKEIEIIDTRGRRIALLWTAKTCIVTDDNIAEPVQVIGADDKVIGIESSIKERGYYPNMADKTITGNQFRGLNYELIAKLKPDVVIMFGHIAQPEATIKQLKKSKQFV